MNLLYLTICWCTYGHSLKVSVTDQSGWCPFDAGFRCNRVYSNTKTCSLSLAPYAISVWGSHACDHTSHGTSPPDHSSLNPDPHTSVGCAVYSLDCLWFTTEGSCVFLNELFENGRKWTSLQFCRITFANILVTSRGKMTHPQSADGGMTSRYGA